MNSEDLLYTNTFTRTQSLTPEQLQRDADNFFPYRTLKANSVNNVRDDLERTVFTDNPIVQRENKAYGWNRGGLANQRPVLSDFARDIGESSYFRYRTTYLNIDSRMRDYGLYPRPNNYSIFLGRKFDYIESIKLIDYFFPDMEYPINLSNNVIMWFTVPYEMIDLSKKPPFDPFVEDLNIVNWYTDFNQLIDNNLDCEESILKFRNNICKSIFKIEIPPGNYTTEDLAATIEGYWRQTQFFNSEFFEEYQSVDYKASPTSPTLELANRPQLVNVRIDPATSQVDFMLRYEEFQIDYLKSYINKNYIDFRIKSEDPLVPSEEYNILVNNELYPIIPTGFPSIGGVINTFLDYYEIFTKKTSDEYDATSGLRQSYYDVVKDPVTGVPIPNIIRLYLYTKSGLAVNCSSTQVFRENDNCQRLCEAYVGREAPFFLIKGTQSPLFQYISGVSNSSKILNPQKCDPCGGKSWCVVLTKAEIDELNKWVCNVDGSIRLLTNLLGFLDTSNALAQVGPENYAFAITPNVIYKANNYINTIQTLAITNQQIIDYNQCEINRGKEPSLVSVFYKSNLIDLEFKLPICKGPNGVYNFYTTNYMFLKLLNPALSNQTSGSQIVQVKPTPAFAKGTSDRYEFRNDEIDGISIKDIFPAPAKKGACFSRVPSLYKDKIAGTKILSKDVDNLFAKIKFSANAGACNPDNPFTNEVIYFEGNVVNLDNFVVQLVDYEGKILQTNGEHCFTLMVVEKIEVLKETNINSRSGYVNNSGSVNVMRNNFSM